jgi:hypothetical protein
VPAEGVGVMKDEDLEVRLRFDAPFQKLLLIFVCSTCSTAISVWTTAILFTFDIPASVRRSIL